MRPEERHTAAAPPVEFTDASAPPLVQRKSSCACGGGCPTCEEKSRAQFQAKLQVSHPGDPYEREADAVADQVLRMPAAGHAHAAESKAGTDGAGGGPRVSRRAAGAQPPAPHVSGAPPSVDKVLRSSGAPLDSSARDFFEPRFGHDFGGVRVHSNHEAAESAGEISARAYTVGNHIVFGAGEYAPASEAGRQLLAHELAHTIQQGAAAPHAAGESDGAHVTPQRTPAPRLQRLPAPRIQRQASDSTFETGSGVGDAITAGTMTTDAAVHGKSFTADKCFGREGCKVKFSFDKAYKGDYNYKAAGNKTVRGIYVKISASYTSATCGPCKELRLLQVLRYITETGGKMETAEPTSDTRRTRAGWGDASAPSRGWMVDALDDSTNPYFTSTWSGDPGSATKPARLWDAPGHWTNIKNHGKEFDTCLICTPASGSATVLGCVNWGYYTDSSGKVAFRPATPVASCGTLQQVTDATQRWDKIPGNTKAGIDFASNPPAPPATK